MKTSKLKYVFISLLTLMLPFISLAQSWGMVAGVQMFDSFNNAGGGPMVGFFRGRHTLGSALIWSDQTTIGGMLQYRFQIGSREQRVSSFLQASFPISRYRDLISYYVQKDSMLIETNYDGLTKGIHFSIGADIRLWKNLTLTTAAGMGHNWIRYIGFPIPDYGYDLNTPNLQFGLTYLIPFRKTTVLEAPLHPETDPDLWLGVQLESALPVIFATVTSPGATYYHPYAEARIAPHMRLQASAWLGSETVYAADTTTRWGVRGIGLAARFHSQQLRRLQFFHTVGLEIVPRPYGQLYKSHIHLANGFSYDIAHRANLEAGMNLRFNTEGYYLAPFLGVAVPLSFRSKLE
jgi:hypothetical protein